MTTTYKLVAFSRNVELPILPDGKHSGYGLVKYEDGIAVGMKTVEVTALYNNMNFANSNDALSGAIDGWVGADDGLLVRDINNNGKIDNGTELFGNNSVLSSGAKAATVWNDELSMVAWFFR